MVECLSRCSMEESLLMLTSVQSRLVEVWMMTYYSSRFTMLPDRERSSNRWRLNFKLRLLQEQGSWKYRAAVMLKSNPMSTLLPSLRFVYRMLCIVLRFDFPWKETSQVLAALRIKVKKRYLCHRVLTVEVNWSVKPAFFFWCWIQDVLLFYFEITYWTYMCWKWST